MKKNLLIGFLLLAIFGFTTVNAQITVTGTVTSAEDGESLPGVSVSVRGTTIGTVTDIDGSYSIEVPTEESVLRFSFVGMLRRDIMVGTQRIINVELQPDVVGLDEVVVTGYGVQRRRDLTGSVSSVRSQEIEGMAVESIGRAIQGRAAGVQVTAASGAPGADVSIIVRGMGSFAANRPIWIVDGIEIQTAKLSSRPAGETESVLSAIEFGDIESIDIMKDAAATAIYGARGANGVIVVTTKRGRASDKTDFTFAIHTGYSDVLNERPLMDGPQWIQWRMSAFENRYGKESSQYLTRLQLGVDRNWYKLSPDGEPDISTVPTYDWQAAARQRGQVWDARLTARGGDERTRFYTSLSHNNTDGHVMNYNFKRSAFRVNLDHDASDKLRFELQLNANVADHTTTLLGSMFASPIHGAAGIPPVEPIYDEEGNFFGAPRNVFGAQPAHIINSNKYDYRFSRNVKTIVNLTGSYNLTNHFSYRASVGFDYNHNDEEQWDDPRSNMGLATNGRLYDYNTTAYSTQITQTLSYNNIFGEIHNINGVIGFETWERIYRRTAVRGENFPNPNMNVISAAALAGYWSGTETERTTMGGFGRINYTYNDKYMLTLTGRYDASSRFGAQSKWGFFPAAAIGWRVSSEPFLAKVEQIDNLMVRFSYGSSGSDASGTYASLGLWSGGSQYVGNVGIYPTQLPNEFLTWEQSTTLNLAFSLTAYRGRLNMDLDLYNRWTHKLLLDRPLPGSTGWTSITENVGEMLNEGIELSINTINILRDRFSWSTNFNISFGRSEILELLPGQDFFSDRRMVGRAVQDRNIPIWAGVNPADGRPMYYDKNKNITYNPVYEDRDWMGPEVTPRFGGLTNELKLGNFVASVFFQYSGGNYRYLQDMTFWFCWSGDRNQFSRVWTDRWLEPGHVTDVPIPMHGYAYAGNVQPARNYASHMFQRADYIRLKDLSLTYNVPGSLIHRFRLDNMRIFARGTNLYTWTDYLGTDPEQTGADYGTYPQGKTVTFGISTNF